MLPSVIVGLLSLPLAAGFVLPPSRGGVLRPLRNPRSTSTPTFSSSATSTETPSQNESSSSASRFDSFDYLQHWYAVSWVDDLKPGVPEKITLFDVDYAVVHDGKGKVMAFFDTCPHRQAALSEGRLTSTGYLQCAYHGVSL